MNRSKVCTFLIAVSLVAFIASNACAHGEGVLVQSQGTRLITGAGDDTPGNQELGIRVFGNGLGGDGLSQSPSFFSLTPAPVGTAALPSGMSVDWDFLPMNVEGEVSNLLFWDTTGQVEFTAAGSEFLSLHDPNFNPATVDSASDPVAGLRIGTTTGSALNLHAHRWWWLQDTEGDPASGVYLVALRLRVEGYSPTEAAYFAFSTADTPTSVLNEAVFPWIEANVDLLSSPGDYNLDGYVNGLDYLHWQRHYGSSGLPPVNEGYADGDRSSTVDAADLVVWQDYFGSQGAVHGMSSQASRAGITVPEPSMVSLCAASILIASIGVRRFSRWYVSL